MEPVFISFATAESGYVDEIENLIGSLRELELDHHTEIIESRGSWQANNAYRPRWIRRQLERLQRPVVWLDCDAVVRQQPEELRQEGYDFMGYFHVDGRVAGGTTYWAPSAPSLAFLRDWERRVEIPFEQWPPEYQRLTEFHLRDAFHSAQDLRVHRLSCAYLKIFDKDHDVEPVIEHFQASRRFKSQVGDARLAAS